MNLSKISSKVLFLSFTNELSTKKKTEFEAIFPLEVTSDEACAAILNTEMTQNGHALLFFLDKKKTFPALSGMRLNFRRALKRFEHLLRRRRETTEIGGKGAI